MNNYTETNGDTGIISGYSCTTIYFKRYKRNHKYDGLTIKLRNIIGKNTFYQLCTQFTLHEVPDEPHLKSHVSKMCSKEGYKLATTFLCSSLPLQV